LVNNKFRMFDGATSFDISAICCWNNEWQELFGCGGQFQCLYKPPSSSPQKDPNDFKNNNQSSSPSIRFEQGLYAAFVMSLCMWNGR